MSQKCIFTYLLTLIFTFSKHVTPTFLTLAGVKTWCACGVFWAETAGISWSPLTMGSLISEMTSATSWILSSTFERMTQKT